MRIELNWTLMNIIAKTIQNTTLFFIISPQIVIQNKN